MAAITSEPAGLDELMREAAPRPLTRYLPHVAAATIAVVVAPLVIVWRLRAAGVIESALLGALCGMALSLAASYIGGAIWQARSSGSDLVFADLMIWGWLRRWRIERRLATSIEQLNVPRDASASDTIKLTERARLLEQLAGALEARDPYTHGHSRRVARHASIVAQRLGLSSAEIARVRTAATLHDIGKINTPIAILHKPGRLSDEEFAVIKRHPGDGADMVAGLDDPELVEMVRHHHERLDGSGYPSGLVGDEIPIGARIIAVADTFDAVTSRRPYRSASSHRRAMAILNAEAGTQLDPGVVRAFSAYYLGLGPAALWALASNAAERALASVSGSIGGAAASAKVLTVAALTAGAAVATPAAPVPAQVGHHPRSVAAHALTAQPHPTPARAADTATRSSAHGVSRAGRHVTGRAGTRRHRQPAARHGRRKRGQRPAAAAPVSGAVAVTAPATTGSATKQHGQGNGSGGGSATSVATGTKGNGSGRGSSGTGGGGGSGAHGGLTAGNGSSTGAGVTTPGAGNVSVPVSGVPKHSSLLGKTTGG